ncbi:hypothetical protein JCM11641_006320 [Rhodosporidiobolus odoratus]
MLSQVIYLACFLALAASPFHVAALPIPPRESTLLPLLSRGFNAQPPLSRPTLLPQLHFAADAHDEDSSPSALATFLDHGDSIFAESGVEASLAAVMAARRIDPDEEKARALPVQQPGFSRMQRKVQKRDWVVPGQAPAASSRTTTPAVPTTFISTAISSSFTTPASAWTMSTRQISSPSSSAPSSAPPSSKIDWVVAPVPTVASKTRQTSFGKSLDPAF